MITSMENVFSNLKKSIVYTPLLTKTNLVQTQCKAIYLVFGYDYTLNISCSTNILQTRSDCLRQINN